MPVLLKFLLPKPGTTYPPTEPSVVNSSTPIKIKNEHFDGEISMWIKDYNGLKNGGEEMHYFGQPGREGSTYAIVVKGESSMDAEHFLRPFQCFNSVFGHGDLTLPSYDFVRQGNTSNPSPPTIYSSEMSSKNLSEAAYHGERRSP